MDALGQSLLNVSGSLCCVSAKSIRPSSACSLFTGSGCGSTGWMLKAKEQVFSRSMPSSGDGKRGVQVVAMAKSAASGYAAALADVGQASGKLDEVFSDVEKLRFYAEDETFWTFITSPVVRDEEKKGVLKSLSDEAQFQEPTANLLNLLVDKKRTAILRELVKEFEELYNQITDTQVAFVTSAIEIQESQLSLISQKVQRMSGSKNVKLKNIVDPAIIAGFIIRFGKDGSRLIDMSVKGQLDSIAAQIDLADKAPAAV